jgi:hypothetical protein
MSGCLSTTSLGAQWFYPVIDPYRCAGPGPYAFGYPFAWDAVVIRVARNPSLSRCQMRVELSSISSTLAETKQIQAFNYYNNSWSDYIDTDPAGAVTAMTIEKRRPGQGCDVGADTVVLARADLFGPKAFYTFPPDDFWDFWGGCTVTFEWQFDADYFHGAAPFGPSGLQTPPPRYPIVRFPDRTLMRDAAGTGSRVVFGGTDFAADDSIVINGVRYLDAFDPITAVPFSQLPPTPVDGTLVREWNRPEVYVIYGGAKFHIPDPPTLFALGFDWTRVGVIPPNGTSKLLQIPIDGTLIKEQHDPRIFLVDKQTLRRVQSPAVMAARCLPWRHVRTVPDTTLATLPRGPDLLKDADVGLEPPPLDPDLPRPARDRDRTPLL